MQSRIIGLHSTERSVSFTVIFEYVQSGRHAPALEFLTRKRGACPLPDCEFVYVNPADVAKVHQPEARVSLAGWRAAGRSAIRGYSRSPRWRNGASCLSSSSSRAEKAHCTWDKVRGPACPSKPRHTRIFRAAVEKLSSFRFLNQQFAFASRPRTGDAGRLALDVFALRIVRAGDELAIASPALHQLRAIHRTFFIEQNRAQV